VLYAIINQCLSYSSVSVENGLLSMNVSLFVFHLHLILSLSLSLSLLCVSSSALYLRGYSFATLPDSESGAEYKLQILPPDLTVDVR
jgi:hypothetical protein